MYPSPATLKSISFLPVRSGSASTTGQYLLPLQISETGLIDLGTPSLVFLRTSISFCSRARPGNSGAGGGSQSAENTLTAFTFTNSFKPYMDSSLPTPDLLMPPNGTRGSDFTREFTKTIPHSRRPESLLALSIFLVQRLAPNPKSEEFASRIAS